MDEIKMNISFPLDNDGFFRRACPFCQREFKIKISNEELKNLIQKSEDSYMLKKEEISLSEKESFKENEIKEFYCPYCGQEASAGRWWTIEQKKYIQTYMENIMTDIINKNFVEKMKKGFQGNKFIKFEGKKLKMKEPQISSDDNDMMIINLSCCQSKIKILKGWAKIVYCFYCGFPHKSKNIKSG